MAPASYHTLLEAEKAMFESGGIIGIGHIGILHMGIGVLFVVVFYNMESAFIHVKMNIAFLKIRGSGFPD